MVRATSGSACESADRGLVDGVVVAEADGEDIAGGGVDGLIQQTEPWWPLGGEVELDPGEAGEVTADLPLPELFAGDPAVSEIVEDGGDRVEDGRAVAGERGEVVDDLGVEGEEVAGRRWAGTHSVGTARRCRSAATSAEPGSTVVVVAERGS